ncbi:MAG: hypothetical protein ACFCUT_05265 [Kiloniellaceae bacterium]
MTGSLCKRRVLAAVVGALLVALAAPDAPARNEGGERNEPRDTQSRNEQSRLNHIPLITDDGRLAISRVILIRARIVEIAEPSLGVEIEGLDRADVSDIPLLGSLFAKPLSAGDFTPENRVGSVYLAGEDTLAAVLDGGGDAGGRKVGVVNGKGFYEIAVESRILEVAPSDLGDFGALPSVQTMIAGTAPRETTIVLGGLTRTSVPEAGGKMPLLADIPVLKRLFRGSVHERSNGQLMILIRPTIIIGEEE